MYRIAPIDALEHVSELRHRDRNDAVRDRRPNEPAAFQPLGVERHAQPIVPQNLDQLAAFAAEHVEIAAVRVALEGFLHQQARVFMPRRMSVWPVAIHTRTPGGIAIIAADPRPALQPPPSPSPGRPRP